MIARRALLGGGLALAACGPALARARPMPAIGIQVFPFLAEAQADFGGTMRAIAAAGYTHVELLAGLAPPAKMAAGTRDAGLKVPSVHASASRLYPGAPSVADDLDLLIATCRAVGAGTLICSTPFVAGGVSPDRFAATLDAFGSADWAAHGAFLNRTSEKVRRAGLRLGYHNHGQEFRGAAGETPFDRLIALTARHDVRFELDCGWAILAGVDPVAVIDRHARRIDFLHLKDLAKDAAPGVNRTTALGDGRVDIPAIVAAGRRARVRAMLVELEPPFAEPPLVLARRSRSFLARSAVA